jgi:hypothetical protein
MGIRETNLVKKAGRLILPPGGAWIIVKGNCWAGRGNRILTSHRREGIKHFDVYWAYDEECPWEFPSKLKIDWKEDPDDLLGYLLDTSGIGSEQLTWMTLHTPSSEHIRMYSGEVFKTSEETIKLMLMDNGLETHAFQGPNVIWDEMTRDMVGSLMIDGLSLQEAQNMLISARAMKKKEIVKPNWFYRPIGVYRETFSEEPEYEAWYAPKEEVPA